MIKIAILGCGQLGTALAGVISKNINYEVVLYTLDQQTCDCINNNNYNDKYLSNYKINAKATTDINEAIKNAETIFLTVPSFAVLSVASEIALCKISANIVLCSKGFNEIGTNIEDLFFSNCVQKILPNNNISVFAGPSFADGIIAGVSTAVSLAGDNFGVINDYFAHSNIVLYKSNDIIGVQVLAAIKGIVAIKIGILEAIGQSLAKAENINKGLYTNKIYKTLSEMLMEMRDIIVAFGGEESTIITPAGIGDTVMVCNSDQSRNKRFGFAIGDILWAEMLKVANGDMMEVRKNFLNGDIETDLLSVAQIESALSFAGGVVEGYFAIPKLAKILKNITAKTEHFDWICDLI